MRLPQHMTPRQRNEISDAHLVFQLKRRLWTSNASTRHTHRKFGQTRIANRIWHRMTSFLTLTFHFRHLFQMALDCV